MIKIKAKDVFENKPLQRRWKSGACSLFFMQLDIEHMRYSQRSPFVIVLELFRGDVMEIPQETELTIVENH